MLRVSAQQPSPSRLSPKPETLTVQQTERAENLDGARVCGDDMPAVARCAEDRAPDGRPSCVACGTWVSEEQRCKEQVVVVVVSVVRLRGDCQCTVKGKGERVILDVSVYGT